VHPLESALKNSQQLGGPSLLGPQMRSSPIQKSLLAIRVGSVWFTLNSPFRGALLSSPFAQYPFDSNVKFCPFSSPSRFGLNSCHSTALRTAEPSVAFCDSERADFREFVVRQVLGGLQTPKSALGSLLSYACSNAFL